MIPLGLLLACAGGERLHPQDEAVEPRLPREAGAYAPSLLALHPEQPLGIAELEDDASCGECHREIAAQWASSAHGRASLDNPWYRASVDALREEAGFGASRHCAGCHDPALLLTGAMDQPIDPTHPRNTVGVSCRMCHGAVEATADGNASLTLAGGQVIAVEGDETLTERHREDMSPAPLRTAALCASCHRGFLSPDTGNTHAVVGMDDPGAWRGSPYAGSRAAVLEPPREPVLCVDCHMPPEATSRGELASHRFAGAHTALAALTGDRAQLEATQAMLRGAAVVDLVGVRRASRLLTASELDAAPGELTLEVVVRNEGAGHSFPGGVKDTQDTWVEVMLHTATGRPLGQSGVTPGDPLAHRLDTAPVDGQGHREQLHRTARFRVPAWDHTVPPRQARAVRYITQLPADLRPEDWPLVAELRLLHRAHAQPMQDFACASGQTEAGRALREAAGARGLPDLDACEEPPVTTVSWAKVWLGPGARPAQGGAARPAARRWLDLAQGLTLLETERLAEARDALERGRALAGEDPWLLAEADWIEATVDGLQGRADAAAQGVERGLTRVGPQAALFRAFGRALARVWRWDEAAEALRRAAELAPQDTAAWRELAQALGSLGRSDDALGAATRGLALWPRDPTLLRSQALALRDQAHPLASAAEDAWLRWRGADDASSLALACGQRSAQCRARRAPVPQVALWDVTEAPKTATPSR